MCLFHRSWKLNEFASWKKCLLLYLSFNKVVINFRVLGVNKMRLLFITSHCTRVCWRLSEVKEMHIFFLWTTKLWRWKKSDCFVLRERNLSNFTVTSRGGEVAGGGSDSRELLPSAVHTSQLCLKTMVYAQTESRISLYLRHDGKTSKAEAQSRTSVIFWKFNSGKRKSLRYAVYFCSNILTSYLIWNEYPHTINTNMGITPIRQSRLYTQPPS